MISVHFIILLFPQLHHVSLHFGADSKISASLESELSNVDGLDRIVIGPPEPPSRGSPGQIPGTLILAFRHPTRDPSSPASRLIGPGAVVVAFGYPSSESEPELARSVGGAPDSDFLGRRPPPLGLEVPVDPRDIGL